MMYFLNLEPYDRDYKARETGSALPGRKPWPFYSGRGASAWREILDLSCPANGGRKVRSRQMPSGVFPARAIWSRCCTTSFRFLGVG